MSKPQLCTVHIDPEQLSKIIQNQIISIRRAINSSDNDEINAIREKIIADLGRSIASINQQELPLKQK